MKNYIYYLLLLALSISCTANKKGIDKTEKQTDQLVYTHVSGENLKSDSTLWGMKIDFVKDGHLFIQELSNDLLYGVYRIEDDSLIKEGGFLTKGEGPFEVVHPDLWGNEDDSVFYVSNYAGIIKEIYSIKMADIYHKEKWNIIPFPDSQGCLFYPSIAIMNDSICVVSGSKLSSVNILSYVNLQTGEISDLDFPFPGFVLPSDFKTAEHMIYCDAQLLKHPSQNKLLYVCRLGRYVKIVEIELRYITRRDAFIYPVCFDEMDDFNRLNHFPGEMTFQTFLLDKDNKVVAIGNPVHNPKLKELYLKILTGGKAEKVEIPMTEVSMDVASIDFGSFPQLEKQERKFTLTNTGQHVLVIYDVVTSCGCTKVNYSKEGIRPGEKAVQTVIYEAEKAEHFSKTVTIYCNADNSPLRLKITGNAE